MAEQIDRFTVLDTHPVTHYRLSNGLQALLLENPISNVAAYLTLYGVGSASERDDQRGLAHFFEHMMFRETTTLADGDFDRVMSQIGGVGLNAYTSYDVTSYHVNVPSPHLKRVMELEADRMVNLRLSKELIERERGAVLGEMKMYEDLPSEEAWKALMEAAFPHHPYRHPIIGYQKQVEGFKDQDFAAFYRQHYAPDRAVVVIAGGYCPQQVLSDLEAAYGGIPPAAKDAAPSVPSVPSVLPVQIHQSPLQDFCCLELTHEKISTENLLLASPTPGLSAPDMPALLLLVSLIGAGQSSPLYRGIVLEGLASQVSASLLETEMMLSAPGLFVFDAAARHGVEAARVAKAICEVLEELMAPGMIEKELERARNQLIFSYYSGMGSNMSLARQLGNYALICADGRHGEQLLQRACTLDASKAREALERYLCAAPRITVLQRPGKKAGGQGA